jgi:Trk-type K+ transport system membrane component
MDINQLREKINLFIYDSKTEVLRWLNIISLLVSISSVGVIIYYYGYEHSQEELDSLFLFMQTSFAFYIFRYAIRIIYDFDPKSFIKRTWLEGLLITMLIVDAISYNFAGTLVIQQFFKNIGFENFTGFSTIFLQFYILIIVAIDLKKESQILPKIKINPPKLFAITFLILMAIGTFLLMLPEMTVAEGSMPFTDALFTSTSATCVTGLIVVDTGVYFTFKGQFILLLLMQLGGLNIVSFGAFTALFSKFGVGMRHHDNLEDFLFKNSVFSSSGLLGKIILGTLFFELVGTIFIFWLINEKIPDNSLGDNLFFSLFHAVSAFNNAGFSTITDSLFNEFYRHFFILHVIIMILVFFGSLGFDTLLDLFKVRNMKERLKYPWKRPKMGSLLNIYSTLALLILGAVIFMIFEWHRNFEAYNAFNATITSLFQSMTLRSAGFNTIDIGNLALPTLITSIILMFIGGASSSTAGGIKTSTFSVLFLSAYSVIRRKKHIEVFRRTIPQDIVFRAFSTFIFSLIGVAVAVFILVISEESLISSGKFDFVDLIFEEVSAFATVGLSTGVTPHLSEVGKYVIIASMFIGRIGTLTLVFALSSSIVSTNYKYPDEHMLIG